MTRVSRRALMASVLAPTVLTTGSEARPFSAFAQTLTAPLVTTETTITSEFPVGVTMDTDLFLTKEDAGARVEIETRVISNGDTWVHFVVDSLQQPTDPTHLTVALDFQSAQIPPGIELESSWRIVNPNGSTLQTEPFRYWWLDDRWSWEAHETSEVVVHTFDSDDETVNGVLSSIQSTVQSMSTRFQIESNPPFHAWLYPSNDAFRDVLLGNSRDSIAAISYPEFGVTAGLTTDNNPSEIGRVFPHEICHLMLHRAASSALSFVPLWFDEGLATNVQIGGTSLFPDLVRGALAQRKLFGLGSLAEAFPFDAAGATLAYASSFSALSFLQQRWGDQGISSLLNGFNSGVGVDNAFEQALGFSLNDFDEAWKSWIAQ